MFHILEFEEANKYDIYKFLYSNLPFSLNMIGCMEHFNERTNVFYVKDGDIIKACMLIFRSGYNDRDCVKNIWKHPVVIM